MLGHGRAAGYIGMPLAANAWRKTQIISVRGSLLRPLCPDCPIERRASVPVRPVADKPEGEQFDRFVREHPEERKLALQEEITQGAVGAALAKSLNDRFASGEAGRRQGRAHLRY